MNNKKNKQESNITVLFGKYTYSQVTKFNPKQEANRSIWGKKKISSFHTRGSTQVNLFSEICYFSGTESIVAVS